MGDQKAYNEKKQYHFVLVHGACHGAWSWYKLLPLLKAAGHRATAVDMAASGIDLRALRDVKSMADYSQPLLELVDSLPPNDKVILVGHSLGGLPLSLAMEKFPAKIAAAAFVTAFLPDTVHSPAYVLEQFVEKMPPENWMDTEFGSYEGTNGTNLTSMFFGPKFFAFKLYQLSPIEDLELALTLARPGSLFIEDLTKEKNLSENAYGVVPRVYVVCGKDMAIPEEFQRWMIENSPATDVFAIRDADHMPMFCKPQELCDVLVNIGVKYA